MEASPVTILHASSRWQVDNDCSSAASIMQNGTISPYKPELTLQSMTVALISVLPACGSAETKQMSCSGKE
jgi:hypothetical protein